MAAESDSGKLFWSRIVVYGRYEGWSSLYKSSAGFA